MDVEEIEIDVRSPIGFFNYYSYQVQSIDDKAINYQIYSDYENNELSISHHGRLINIRSGICIRNRSIAQEYLEKNIKKWRKQWGNEVDIKIVTMSTSDRGSFFNVLEHTDTVLRRLGK